MTLVSTYPLPFLALVTLGSWLPIKASITLRMERSMRDCLSWPPQLSGHEPLGLMATIFHDPSTYDPTIPGPSFCRTPHDPDLTVIPLALSPLTLQPPSLTP